MIKISNEQYQKWLYPVYIAVLVVSFISKTYAAFRPQIGMAQASYEMTKALLNGQDPYSLNVDIPQQYLICVYFVYGIGVLLYDSVFAIKLMNSWFGWLDAVLLYVIYRQKDQKNFGALVSSLFLLSYGQLISFGFFAANDTITIFFVLLSYHLWIKGHEQLSILSLVIGAATKFYPILILPYILAFAFRKNRLLFLKCLITVLISGGLIIGIVLFRSPGYIELFFRYTKVRSISRLDNFAFAALVVNYLASTSDNIKLIVYSINQLLFVFSFVICLYLYVRRCKTIENAYLLPCILFIIFPLTGFLWTNFLIWILVPSLLIPRRKSIGFAFGLLFPEYFIRMGNFGPEEYKVVFYLFGSLSLLFIAIFMLYEYCWLEEYKETETNDPKFYFKSVILFLGLQIVLILAVGLVSANFFWFV